MTQRREVVYYRRVKQTKGDLLMTITASRQLYEVNLYCELFYPEHETEQGR